MGSWGTAASRDPPRTAWDQPQSVRASGNLHAPGALQALGHIPLLLREGVRRSRPRNALSPPAVALWRESHRSPRGEDSSRESKTRRHR